VFWVISVYFNIRNTLPKSGTLLLGHSVYVNDLAKTVNDKTVPILFAGDTSMIVKSPNSNDFQTNMVTAFNCVNICFNSVNAELNPICHLLALLGANHILHVSRIRVKVNLLSINVDITHYIKFKTKNKPNNHCQLCGIVNYIGT